MSRAPLSVVVSDAPETLAQRVQRAQADVAATAREHAATVMRDLEALLPDLEIIGADGSPYPPGLRSEAYHMAREIGARLKTIQSITGRSGR